MDVAEYQKFDTVGLAELVSRREVSAGELLDAALERLSQINPSLNAVVLTLEGQARQAIAKGLPAGPFSGAPFLLGDITTQMAGVVTSAGSRVFAQEVGAPRTAPSWPPLPEGRPGDLRQDQHPGVRADGDHRAGAVWLPPSTRGTWTSPAAALPEAPPPRWPPAPRRPPRPATAEVRSGFRPHAAACSASSRRGAACRWRLREKAGPG